MCYTPPISCLLCRIIIFPNEWLHLFTKKGKGIILKTFGNPAKKQQIKQLHLQNLLQKSHLLQPQGTSCPLGNKLS